MKQRIEAWLMRQWYQKSTWIHALAPFSWACHILTHAGYIRPATVTKKPIWIIGNMTVGGVGKTPFVIALIKRAQAHQLKVLVVVKPYRVPRLKQSVMLPNHADPRYYGDEAVLIQEKTRAHVLCIAKDRCDLYAYMAAYDLVICDDGLQNKHLKRSMNWMIMDQQRGFGNGHLLPRGPLRSLPQYWLKHVNQTVVKCTGDHPNTAYGFQLVIDGFKHLKTQRMAMAEAFKGKKLLLVCGIGHPAQFFAQLSRMGIEGDQLVMVDHHAYKLDDCIKFKDYDAVIMTEKDGVKCRRFGLTQVYVTQTSTRLTDQLVERCDVLLKDVMNHGILI